MSGYKASATYPISYTKFALPFTDVKWSVSARDESDGHGISSYSLNGFEYDNWQEGLSELLWHSIGV